MHYNELRVSCGNRNITQDQARDLFSQILADDDLGIYTNLYDKMLCQHSLSAEQSSQLAERIAGDLPSANNSVQHRSLLLEMANSITVVGNVADDLSKVLFEYKENGADAGLRGKAYEKYDKLIRENRINEYFPPPPSEEETD